MRNTTINVKGADYQVKFVDYLTVCGFTNYGSKLICIKNDSNLEEFRGTIIHELLHAYLDECGLFNYSNDETLISWLEVHFFEIYKKLCEIVSMNKNVNEEIEK